MASKSDEIKIETYSSLSKLVSEMLNTNDSTSLINKSTKRIKCEKLSFILYNKIFYFLLSQGLFDSLTQVKQFAQSILSNLLKCELIVTEQFKEKLTQLILIYMPFIQCHASTSGHDALGALILKLSDNNSIENSFLIYLTPLVERLKCSLRYLYSKEKLLRKRGFEQFVEFFFKFSKTINSSEEDASFVSNGTCSSFNSSSSSVNDFYLKYLPEKYCDLILNAKNRKTPRTFSSYNDSNNLDQETCIFKVDNLHRIYSIFTGLKLWMFIYTFFAANLSVLYMRA